MNKPYTRILKEDFFPYLVNILSETNTKYKYKYIFYIPKGVSKSTIFGITHKYKCWKQISPQVFTYETDSTTLKDMFIQSGNQRSALLEQYPTQQLQEEKVEDIPKENPIFKQEYVADFNVINAAGKASDHMLDAFSNINTVTGRFKTKKEIEMSNKLKVNYSINISVDGHQITLSDPVNPDAALDAVLVLNKRLSALTAQKETLQELEDTTNVSKVLDEEIAEIKETIEYINDNIKES